MSIDNIKEKYINFYTDYAFKRFFGTEANKELLIDFLNALFADSGEGVRIEDIEYLREEQLGHRELERRAIFDVYCRSTDGEYFIVEMQNARQEFFKDRTLYYSTFPIRDESERGNWNFNLKKIYSVNILNFVLEKTEDEKRKERESGKEDDRYVRFVKLMDTEIKTVFYEKLTFVYLETPKFKKDIKECESLLDKWLFAIRHLSNLDNQPEELCTEIFNRLFEIAEVAKFSKPERFAYEESLNIMRDYENTLDYREKVGYDKGEKDGMEKGEKVGVQKEKIETVLRLKDMELSIEQISMGAGLTTEEVEEILGESK